MQCWQRTKPQGLKPLISDRHFVVPEGTTHKTFELVLCKWVRVEGRIRPCSARLQAGMCRTRSAALEADATKTRTAAAQASFPRSNRFENWAFEAGATPADDKF